MKKLTVILFFVLFFTNILAQNLVNNPGFETDDDNNNYPDQWNARAYSATETNPDYVHSGNVSLLIQADAGGLNTWTQYGTIYNHNFKEFKENTQYIMSFWVKTQGLQNGDFIRLFHTSSPTPGAGYPTAQLSENAAEWTKVQTSFTTLNNNGASIGGNIHFGCQISANAKVWIDDVSVVENIPAVIQIETTASTLMADGNSFATLTAKIYDNYGNFLPVATNEVSFSLSGPGELIGANPNVCVNGQTSITYKTSETTGTATITASASGLTSDNVNITIIDYGHQGVPQFTLDYTADVERDWWAFHPFNKNAPTYNPNIISPEPFLDIADYGNDIQAAINALPAEGGTIVFENGQTYFVPATGISIEARSNIHFISNGNATIKAPSNFTGIPQPDGATVNAMFQIMPVPGDWHDDNYINNAALANPARNFYFKNLTFDGNAKVETGLNFWATSDVVFDNCTFYGATGLQEMHIGAWSNNFWARGCSFKGTANHALIWDGTHGSGILNCSFENTISGSVQIVFLSNDDCTRDVINDGNNYGTWQPEEIRLGNYIVVADNTFGVNSSSGKVAIAASARNILVKNNSMLTGAYRFYEIGPRCTQMTHPYDMPGYNYNFFDNRIIGNVVQGNLTQFVNIKTNPNTNCTGSEHTSNGQPNGSQTGWYQVRGNVVGIVTANFVNEDEASGNPVVGDNTVCGNCINSPDCNPNSYYNCETPEPSYEHLGCYTTAGPTYYLDAANGNDANSGTAPNQAWKTFEHAIENMTSASTLVIREGMYEIDNSQQHYIGGNAGGVNEQNATVVKAASGERVLITGNDGKPPRITLDNDYIRMEGLWFGGEWDISNGHEFQVSGGGRLDHGREIVGCTFFGYKSIRGGLVEHTFWQNNRFVRCGVANDPPMVYMSGDHNIGYGNHDIFDKNMFITGRGYAINGWHTYHNFIVTRNFVGNVWGGIIADGRGSEYQGNVEGSDHLIANNIFWNSGEGQGQGFNAATLIASNTHYLNNIHVDNSNIAVSYDETYGYETLENFVVNKNAFNNISTTFTGDNSVDMEEGSELSELGVSKSEIDNTIAAIDNAFEQSASNIFSNENIHDLFAVIENISIPQGSPLYASGSVWDSKQNTMNIGTDIEAPGHCASDFWNVLPHLNIRQWNGDGNMVFSQPEFTFSDGSGSTNYRGTETGSDAVDFKAIMAPHNATTLTLSFLEFDTEQGDDFVRIYDSESDNANLLGEFSGSNIPENITSATGKMVLHFQTDNDNNTGQGWKVSYTSDGTNTAIENDFVQTNNQLPVVIYPNPSKDYFVIEVKENSDLPLIVEIYTITGLKLDSFEIKTTKYHISRKFPSGIYIVKVANSSRKNTLKIIMK